MSKWTKDEVLEIERILRKHSTGLGSFDYEAADMLREYAAHLAAQAEWPSEEVIGYLVEKKPRVVNDAPARSFYFADKDDPTNKDWWIAGEQKKYIVTPVVRAALQSVRPPVGVSDDRLHKAIDTLLWINEEVWPLVHGLTSRETLRKRFRELPSLIEYLASRHASTKG